MKLNDNIVEPQKQITDDTSMTYNFYLLFVKP